MAKARCTNPKTLRRTLDGELDWITLKALERDRDRRYGSVAELAEDIQRYLSNQPVLAGPPTASYRIRKFVSRHRFGAVAVLALTAVTLLGLVGTTQGLLKARRAEADAHEQARTADEVVQFMLDIFQSNDPFAKQPAELSARELLERGRAKIDERLEDEPQVRSALLSAMGQVYARMGLYDESEPLLQEALDVLREDSTASLQEVAGGTLRLAQLLRDRGRHAEAEPLLLEAIDLLDRGSGNVDHRAAARQQLGVILRDRGELADARKHLEQSLSLREDGFGRGHTKVAHSLYHLGWLEHLSGKSEQAERLYRRALAIWQKELGPEHASTSWTHNDLGVVLAAQNKLAEALGHYQQAVAIQRKQLGEDHPARAAPLHNLGNLFGDLGRYDEAVASLQQAIRIREASLGPQHPELAGSLDALGFQLRRLGRYEEARVQLERGLEMVAATLGVASPGYAAQLNNLASLERDVNRFHEARSLMQRALQIQVAALGDDNPQIAMTLSNLAAVEYTMGDYLAAADKLERALVLRKHDTAAAAWTVCQLAHCYDRLQLADQARTAVQSGLDLIMRLATEGTDASAGIRVRCLLLNARLEARDGHHGQARESLREAEVLLDQEPTRESTGSLEMQAATYALLGDAEAAIEHLRRSVAEGLRQQEIRDSTDFDSLRDDPRFAHLMKTAAEDL